MGPTLSFDPAILLKAQQILVAFFDVDGVLTDGSLLYTEQGETIKNFNSLDGHGIKMLQMAGITPVVITGRDSKPLHARLQSLGIKHSHFGIEDKAKAAESTLAALGLDWTQAAAIGDDWPDLSLFERCAFACAPANAHAEVLVRSHYITKARGGAGAAREFCDILLVASGRYSDLLSHFLNKPLAKDSAAEKLQPSQAGST